MAFLVQLRKRRRALIAGCLLLLALPLFAQSRETRRVEISFDIPAESELTPRRLRRFAGGELKSVEQGEGSAATLADIVYRMRSRLVGEGYPEAAITMGMYNATPAGDVEIDSSSAWEKVDSIVLRVRPGRRVYMGEIEFDGNSVYGDERLRSYFVPGEQGVYVREKIDAGIGRIGRLYALDGYDRFAIENVEISSREEIDRLLYDVTIAMREGPRFVIDEVAIDGRDLTRDEELELSRSIDIVGSAYFPRRISEGALLLERILGQRGYTPTIEREVDLRDDGGVAVTYRIEKGPRQVIESVAIRNAGARDLRTKRGFLLSFVTVETGETVDFNELDRIENRLYGLGLFAYVDLHTEPLSEDDGISRVRLVVEVEELSSQYIELEAGWNSYELIRGAVTFIDRNLFGLGRQISMTLHGSLKAWGGEASISDRMLLGQGSTVALTGSYGYREAPSFTQSTAGGELSAAYQFNPAFGAGTSYEYTRSVTSEVSGDIAGSEQEVLTTGRVRVFGEHDTRNSVVFPVRGSYLRAEVFTAPELLGSDIGFYGGHGEARFHLPLFDRLTLTAAGDYRFRARFESRRPLPIQERLFLGGSTSVRAYGQDELGLVGTEGTSRGGMSSLAVTAETRVRLAGSLYTALFWDAGFLGADSYSLNGDFGQGGGIGILYNLPIGPIRLDAAWNPGELYAADSRLQIHLAVGLSY